MINDFIGKMLFRFRIFYQSLDGAQYAFSEQFELVAELFPQDFKHLD